MGSNLTAGFNQDLGFESIPVQGARCNTVPWMSWSGSDDRLAYFVRKGKYRSMMLQNVATREVEHLIDLEISRGVPAGLGRKRVALGRAAYVRR